MSERILIPLDGSPLGESALRYVEELLGRLASGKKSEVQLLHVISTLSHAVNLSAATGPVTMLYSDDELAQMKRDSEAYLEKSGAGLVAKGIKVSTRVMTEFDAAAAILRAETEFGADLVAMSTHGRSGISRWALGSVSDKVLRGGNVPVLMVRAPKRV